MRSLQEATKAVLSQTPKKLSTRMPSHLKDVRAEAIKEAKADVYSKRRHDQICQIATMAALVQQEHSSAQRERSHGQFVLSRERRGGATDTTTSKCTATTMEMAAVRKGSLELMIANRKRGGILRSSSEPPQGAVAVPQNAGTSNDTKQKHGQSAAGSELACAQVFKGGGGEAARPVVPLEPGDIARLAGKYRIDEAEVREIRRFLEESNMDSSQSLGRDEFEKVLQGIFNSVAERIRRSAGSRLRSVSSTPPRRPRSAPTYLRSTYWAPSSPRVSAGPAKSNRSTGSARK